MNQVRTEIETHTTGAETTKKKKEQQQQQNPSRFASVESTLSSDRDESLCIVQVPKRDIASAVIHTAARVEGQPTG